MSVRSVLISCSHCGRPVEAVAYSPRAEREGFRGYAPFATRHEAEYGCYPDHVNIRRLRGPLPQIGG